MWVGHTNPHLTNFITSPHKIFFQIPYSSLLTCPRCPQTAPLLGWTQCWANQVKVCSEQILRDSTTPWWRWGMGTMPCWTAGCSSSRRRQLGWKYPHSISYFSSLDYLDKTHQGRPRQARSLNSGQDHVHWGQQVQGVLQVPQQLEAGDAWSAHNWLWWLFLSDSISSSYSSSLHSYHSRWAL